MASADDDLYADDGQDMASFFTPEEQEKIKQQAIKDSEAAAKELDFMEAAKLRDRIKSYQEQVKELG